MPSFITHNQDDSININGTHLQGYVDTSYERLVSLFVLATVIRLTQNGKLSLRMDL